MIQITNEDRPCIYMIKNTINGKVYIGQTVNFKERVRKYSRGDCKRQRRLYNSMNKHGIDAHKIEIIANCEVCDLNELERYYQDYYNSTSRNKGLNIRKTSSSDKSGSFSFESRMLMSAAKLGSKRPDEVKDAIRESMKSIAKQRDHTDFKKVNVGRKHSDAHRHKNSKAKIGNTHRRGKPLSDEAKSKLRISRTGRKDSDETKRKKSESAKKAWLKRKSQ